MWFREISKDSDVVVSTRVRLSRNIEGYPFPNFAKNKELKEIIEKMDAVIDKEKYTLFKMKDIDEITKTSLVEQHVISKEFVLCENGAIISNKENTLVVMLNEEDHLRVQAFESGFNVDQCFKEANDFMEEIEKKITISKNKKYGYLTSCPTNVGSGMRVSVMLHLSGLYKMGLLGKLLEQAQSIGLSVRGLYGENTNGYGNMYQISNQKTLGVSDTELINSMKAVITSIIEQERKAREMVKDASVDLADEVNRAYGILKYARNITAEESLKLLSNVRLGAALNLVPEISLEKVQSLMIDSRPATLRILLKDNFDKTEEMKKRAEYIRKELE